MEKIIKVLDLCLEAGIIDQSTVDGTLASIHSSKEWLENHLEDIEKWLDRKDLEEVTTNPPTPTSETETPTGVPTRSDETTSTTLGASAVVVSFMTVTVCGLVGVIA
jgi:hypothetical protein